MNKLFAIFLTGLLCIMGTACSKEGCTDPHSDNYNPSANNDDGTCVPSRDKFIGTYTYTELCDGLGLGTTLIITSNPNSSAQVKVNIGGTIITGECNRNVLTIPYQNVLIGTKYYQISGSADMSGAYLIGNYTKNYGMTKTTCTFEGRKKS